MHLALGMYAKATQNKHKKGDLVSLRGKEGLLENQTFKMRPEGRR
jgi:hypothetical protein